MDNQRLVCPDCGADLKDWRNFSAKLLVDEEKPFECVGFRCGKRWKTEEILPTERTDD